MSESTQDAYKNEYFCPVCDYHWSEEHEDPEHVAECPICGLNFKPEKTEKIEK